MNERIRQLAAQSGFDDVEINSPCDELKKFAELLIRECIDIVDCRNGWINDENRDSQFVYGYEKAVRHCSVFIKEHFGVD